MTELPNPAVYLEYLHDVFVQGAEKPDGIACDPALCRGFAAGLAEIIDHVDTMSAYLDALGRAERAAGICPRTPVERQLLARLVLADDPGARVIRFPTPPLHRATASEGSPAA